MSEIKPQFNQKDLQRVFEKNTSFCESDFLHHEMMERLADRLSLIKIAPKKILVIDLAGSQNRLCELYPDADIEVLTDFPDKLNQEENSIDMVFSNLFFHWSPSPEALFKEISRALKPNGLVMFTLLGPDSLKEIRFSWAVVDKLPHVHDFYDMHDVGDSLMRSDFSEPVMDMEQLTVDYKTTQAMFNDLKNTRSINILSDRRKTLTGKKRFHKFLKAFEKYKKDDKYSITLEIIYGHAWGGVVKNNNGEIEISIDSIRGVTPPVVT